MTRLRVASRPAVVVIVLAGSGAVVLAAGQGWVNTAVSGVPGLSTVSATGRDAAPGVTAIALVAAAGAAALTMTGKVARVVVSVLLAVAGVAVLALVWSVVADPGAALHPALVRATGQSGTAAAGGARVSGWPWLAAVGGALVLFGGVLAAARGDAWTGSGRSSGAQPAGPGTGEGSGAGTGAGTGDSERDRRLDAWDALSRGEDPTG